jgi:hypothetical protein
VRRKFYELAERSPVAADVLRRIASLYAIQDDIRGLPADERRRICDQRSRPIVDGVYRFLEARGRQVTTHCTEAGVAKQHICIARVLVWMYRVF